MIDNQLSTARDEENRRLAEWLFGVPLDGFGIYSASGARLRDRDFDSAEEAQRYIDSEDERLTESHKSIAHGVHIRPCIKAHPDFYTDEAANALLRRRMRKEIPYMAIHREGADEVVRFVPKTGPIISGRGTTDLEAIVKAALAYLEAQK